MREELFNAVVDSQKKLIESLESNLKTMFTSTDLDEEMTRDLDDHSHQSNLQTMEINIRKKLDMERDDLKNIQTMRLFGGEEIELGRFVETEENFFFFGYSFSPLDFKDKKIIGVSPEAPAFGINKNKKKGDFLQLGEKKLEIKSVY